MITGTESCGKTTLTKNLAKIFHTSWSNEVGRDYADHYLGGNESIYTIEDFEEIARQQYQQDYHALRTANRVAFFDTDAVVTAYYLELYMNNRSKRVEEFIDSTKYDLILFLQPNVPWVEDGKRFKGDQEEREELNDHLYAMYERFFKPREMNKIKIINDFTYYDRTKKAIEIINDLLNGV